MQKWGFGLVVFSFHEPAFVAAQGDAQGPYLAAQHVGVAEIGVAGCQHQLRASFAHGEGDAEACAPLVEGPLSVGQFEA